MMQEQDELTKNFTKAYLELLQAEEEEWEKAEGGEHQHIQEDGTVVTHSHGHNHTHTHTQTRAVLNRLARLIGHLNAVKRMIENNRDCSEVLTQLAAVDAAIKSVSKVILKDHLQHCLVEAVHENDNAAILKLSQSIEQFIK